MSMFLSYRNERVTMSPNDTSIDGPKSSQSRIQMPHCRVWVEGNSRFKVKVIASYRDDSELRLSKVRIVHRCVIRKLQASVSIENE